MKATLLQQKTFTGVQGDFAFDAYGDASRRVFLITVSEGRFTNLE